MKAHTALPIIEVLVGGGGGESGAGIGRYGVHDHNG